MKRIGQSLILLLATSMPVVGCQKSGLPTGAPPDGDCPLEAPLEMTLCDWLASHPNLIVGKVISMRSVSTPYLYYEFVDSETTRSVITEDLDVCPGSVFDGFGVTVEVEDIISGDLTAGETIEVHIGYEVVRRWVPSPSAPKDDGAVEWSENGQENQLYEGQQIGLSASEALDGTFTTGRSQLFLEGPFGIQFQNIDYCDGAFPPASEIASMKFSDLAEAAQACSSKPFDEDERESLTNLFDLTGSDISESGPFNIGGLCSEGVGFPEPELSGQSAPATEASNEPEPDVPG